MMERCPTVGEVVGTSGPRVTDKPRISCTFDLPCAELTKALLDTKWLYLEQHTERGNVTPIYGITRWMLHHYGVSQKHKNWLTGPKIQKQGTG
jgi:hypothetical protein